MRIEQERLEDERERLEEERRLREVAELRAEIFPTTNVSWRIAVLNQGPAKAMRVAVFIHIPQSPQPWPMIEPGEAARRISDRLAPGEQLTADLRAPGDEVTVAVAIEWADSRGQHARDVILKGRR